MVKVQNLFYFVFLQLTSPSQVHKIFIFFSYLFSISEMNNFFSWMDVPSFHSGMFKVWKRRVLTERRGAQRKREIGGGVSIVADREEL